MRERTSSLIWLAVLALVIVFADPLTTFAQQSAVDVIKNRGSLRCSAHNGSFHGFMEVDAKGGWKGFDIDFCRALGTAILGSPDKVTFVPLSWAQRFPSLQSGDVDVLFKATGWTMSRDTKLGLQFSIPYFQGGFQLMVPAKSGVKSAKDLAGATVCTAAGTSIEPVLADLMSSLGIKFQVVTYEKSEELQAAYFAGRCDVYGGWGPSLAVTRVLKVKDPASQVILPITLTLEPDSAVIRQNDKRFLNVVNWTIAALIRAEELGVTSANVEALRGKVTKDPASNPAVARLLGATKGIGEMLGLRETWAYDVVKSTGNYGEIFDRNLGSQSAYHLDRGVNALWKNGGLIYAPVID